MTFVIFGFCYELEIHDVADWTVAVYMNGDNNLEVSITGGFAYARRIIEKMKLFVKGDFHNELARPGSNENVHVVALVDRIPGYSSTMDNWTETRLYYIKPGDFPDDTRGTYWVNPMNPEMDMGDPATLVWFLDTVHHYFPSQKLLLSMWDHNWAWHSGQFESDYTNNQNTISYSDLYYALQSYSERFRLNNPDRGNPITIVAYDACVSSHIEVAHTWAVAANFFVGSQDYIGWDGLNYTEIVESVINSSGNIIPSDLSVLAAATILEDPAVGCSSAITLGSEPDNFYSAIAAIDVLGALFCVHLDNIRSRLITVRERAGQVPTDSSDDEFHRDLYSIAYFSHLEFYDDIPEISAAALNLMHELKKIIIFTRVKTDSTTCHNGNGLSIYWPQSNEMPTLDYLTLSFALPMPKSAPGWVRFLQQF